MKPIVTAKEIAAIDRYSIDVLGITGIVLMENAGRGIAEIALEILGTPQHKNIHIYCGPGNNGGDGFVVARHLINKGAIVHTLIAGSRDKIKGDAKINLDILQNMSKDVTFISRVPSESLYKPDLIIDALLGTGVTGPLRGLFAEIVSYMNELHVPILAVDIPTGVDADTGAVEGPAVQATRTATMALIKRGLLFYPGRQHAGKLHVVDISMPNQAIHQQEPDVWLIEDSDIRRLVPSRTGDAYKNKVGTVAILAGSTGFTGAASLASVASLRSGAGLCYLAVPKSLNVILASKMTEVITWPFDDADTGYMHSESFPELLDRLMAQNAAAIGPGLGQQRETAELVRLLLRELKKPLVLDADGLNVCANNIDLIKNYQGEMVLTPHPGELSRLIGRSTKEIVENRIKVAAEAAKEFGKVVVLKGGPSLVARPDGKVLVNSTGNAGMATAGSGDVLTGLIAGLLAQGLGATDAAIAGVYLHGLAGDFAKEKLGEHGMLAGDILENIYSAIQLVQGN